MCTLLITSNSDHINHALSSPSFMARGTRDSSLYSLDFGDGKEKSTFIAPMEMSAWGVLDQEDIIGRGRLYALHTHSPTGTTWGRHPAGVFRMAEKGKSNHKLTGRLWHNGQIINAPSDQWDTQYLLDLLIPPTNKPDTFESAIKWDALDSLHGSFAGLLLVTIVNMQTGAAYSRLFIFRNHMSPLICKAPQSSIRTLKAKPDVAHPTEKIFLDSSSYVASVPLAGDEKQEKWGNLTTNTVYEIRLFDRGGVPVYSLSPVTYFNNVFDPYGSGTYR